MLPGMGLDRRADGAVLTPGCTRPSPAQLVPVLQGFTGTLTRSGPRIQKTSENPLHRLSAGTFSRQST